MEKTGRTWWFGGGEPISYNHFVYFKETRHGVDLGQTLPYDTETWIDIHHIQSMVLGEPGINYSAMYANALAHEVLYHGVLGYYDSPKADPSTFPSTRPNPYELVKIEETYAKQLMKKLKIK